MAAIISFILLALTSLLAIPVVVLMIEIIAALWHSSLSNSGYEPHNDTRPRVAVLIPAHNESEAILPTLGDIKPQLRTDDRLIVIADNCSDDTAAVAFDAGAEVVQRNDPTQIGKAYALEFGLAHLRTESPAVVVVIDADCRVAAGTIDQLATVCFETRRPAQALDLMLAPDNSSINYRVAEFAWRIKNWLRPLGLRALGLPCQLMGTGMAFPWRELLSVNLASHSIVEDLRLGLDLARAGHPPLFCPSALVTSRFPTSAEAARHQRTRWEHGHISMIFDTAPRYFWHALRQGNLSLLALTIDLAIPPLAALALLLGATFLLSLVAFVLNISVAALVISGFSCTAFVLTTAFAWTKYGRDILPANEIPSVCKYILAKLPIYGRLMSGGTESRWVRTDRGRNE